MSPEKPDFPPLLAGGIHRFNLSDLELLTVDKFAESTRRKPLFESFKVYLGLLEGTGLSAEIWVDGSFMSEKPEPDDIDLVVLFDATNARSLPQDSQQMLRILLDTHSAVARFNLHVFRIRRDDEEAVSYWRQLFGTMRDNATPKGMASLRVNQ